MKMKELVVIKKIRDKLIEIGAKEDSPIVKFVEEQMTESDVEQISLNTAQAYGGYCWENGKNNKPRKTITDYLKGER